jgi:hypothetical protein
MTPAVQKRARAKNAQNCFLYSLLPVVVASTFGFQIDGIETIKHGALGVPPGRIGMTAFMPKPHSARNSSSAV